MICNDQRQPGEDKTQREPHDARIPQDKDESPKAISMSMCERKQAHEGIGSGFRGKRKNSASDLQHAHTVER